MARTPHNPDLTWRLAEKIMKEAYRIIADRDELVQLNAMAAVGTGILVGTLSLKPGAADIFNEMLREWDAPWQIVPCARH
jgi:hypothetical protein